MNAPPPIEYLTPLVEYLKNYNDILHEMSTELTPPTMEIDYMAVESDPQTGYALVVVGTNPITKSTDIARSAYSTITTVNLMLLLRRFNNSNDFRRNTGDFFIQFADWVNFNEVLRQFQQPPPFLPMFSRRVFFDGAEWKTEPLDSTEEKIECMGGMENITEIQQSVSEYQVQLKLTYEVITEK